MTAIPLLSALLLSVPTDPPVAWSFEAVPVDDGLVRVELRAALAPGWHLYATVLPGDEGPLPTMFRFVASETYEIIGELTEPEAEEEYDPNFGMVVRYHSGTPVFTLPVRRRSAGAFAVEGELEYMVCDDTICLPPVTVPFSVQLEALPAK